MSAQPFWIKENPRLPNYRGANAKLSDTRENTNEPRTFSRPRQESQPREIIHNGAFSCAHQPWTSINKKRKALCPQQDGMDAPKLRKARARGAKQKRVGVKRVCWALVRCVNYRGPRPSRLGNNKSERWGKALARAALTRQEWKILHLTRGLFNLTREKIKMFMRARAYDGLVRAPMADESGAFDLDLSLTCFRGFSKYYWDRNKKVFHTGSEYACRWLHFFMNQIGQRSE